MNFGRVEAVANAILYEGYMLYPYRPSALKNHLRWMFGVIQPLPTEGGGRREEVPHCLQSECLVASGADGEVEVKLRFLRPTADAEQDAVPCEVDLGPVRIVDLADRPVSHGFTRGPVQGAVELAAVDVGPGVYKLTLRVLNLTPEAGTPRLFEILHSHHSQSAPPPFRMTGESGSVMQGSSRMAVGGRMVSTHAVLGLQGGEFVPPRDPPPPLAAIAEGCRNDGLWPILAGEPGACDLLLCSPIILDDYPRVAPESPGDLFDCTEIDEILTLRILTLTPEEKREMAAANEQVAALLARTEALGDDRFARLHGALRPLSIDSHSGQPPAQETGMSPAPGDRVRLHPRGRADIFDLALAGMIATVASVEQDYDGRSYVTVTIDDDPGRDLGASGQPGHRFFFGPEEIELLGPEAGEG